MSEYIIEINNLVFSWKGSSSPLINHMELKIREKEITCILGPSGCGKTTILNLIAGFLVPDSGEIRFRNKIVKGPSKERIMVFQDYNQLFPWKTVLGNVMFPMEDKDINRARNLLDMTGLKEKEHMHPNQLSGGMKQRASIARALAAYPSLLLLDEPFDGLDAPTRRSLQDMLVSMEEKDAPAILMVTHDIDEAVYLADRLIVMGDSGNISSNFNNPLPATRKHNSEDFLELKYRLYSEIEGGKTS